MSCRVLTIRITIEPDSVQKAIFWGLRTVHRLHMMNGKVCGFKIDEMELGHILAVGEYAWQPNTTLSEGPFLAAANERHGIQQGII